MAQLNKFGCQISILQVRGPKWHLGTSSRAASVFNSFDNICSYVPWKKKDLSFALPNVAGIDGVEEVNNDVAGSPQSNLIPVRTVVVICINYWVCIKWQIVGMSIHHFYSELSRVACSVWCECINTTSSTSCMSRQFFARIRLKNETYYNILSAVEHKEPPNWFISQNEETRVVLFFFENLLLLPTSFVFCLFSFLHIVFKP